MDQIIWTKRHVNVKLMYTQAYDLPIWLARIQARVALPSPAFRNVAHPTTSTADRPTLNAFEGML